MNPLFAWTSHEDRFVIDNCPEPALTPWMDEVWFRSRGIGDAPFNAVSALLEKHLHGAVAAKPALLSDEPSWTYAELARAAAACGMALRKECGIRPGNRVLLQAGNSPWLVAALLGTLRIGAVAVLAAASMSGAELAGVLCQTRPALRLHDGTPAEPAPNELSVGELAERAISYRDSALAEPPLATAPTDPAVILFTSGSTGAQKASVNLHRDLMVVGETYFKHVLPMTARDVIIGTPALSFAYGLETMLLAPLAHGASVVLHRTPHALPVLELAARMGATQIYSTPAAYRAMLEVIAGFRLPALRACGSAGENLTEALADRWRAATGVPLTTGMGTTEVLAFLLGSPADQAPVGSCGRAVAPFEARVVDEGGAMMPPGQIGQLAVRGPTGYTYLANPAAQRERLRDGWTTTGDLFACDTDGVFWYHGRADDIIIRAGTNIPGLEIENAILELEQAKECAVVGQFDPERQTNRIVAYVVAEAGAEPDALHGEIARHLARRLTKQKWPDRVEFIRALPRSANGKIQRFRLRDPAAAPAG